MHPSRHAGNSLGHSDVLPVILGALAIVIGSSALGIAVNHLSPRGIPLLPKPATTRTSVRQEQAPAPAIPLPKDLEPIPLSEARSAFDAHQALFIDARPPDQYADGHIPGALSLSADAFDDQFPNLADQIESNPFLIVYCEGAECSESIHVAERLVEYGFLGARVMVDGFRAWADAGHPVARGARP